MAKIMLVTGFEPFGGETVNPAWEAVSRLPERVGEWTLRALRVPTVFGSAAEAAAAEAEKIGAQAILCVGLAGGRAGVTPEMIGINLRWAAIPDNAGNMPQDEPVAAEGPAAYFSTLPARRMAEAIEEAGVPAGVSYTAGVYVCNDLLYSLLHRFRDTGVRVGFIHVPFLPEQARNGEACMELQDMIRALTAAVACA